MVIRCSGRRGRRGCFIILRHSDLMMIVSDLKAVVHLMSFWVLTVIVLLLNLQRNKMIKAGDGGDVLCVWCL